MPAASVEPSPVAPAARAAPLPKRAGAPRDAEAPVVLVVHESGTSGGRDLFAPGASPESAVSHCGGGRGYVLLRAQLVDTRLVVGSPLEREGLSDGDVQCVREALGAVPLAGGRAGEQLVYVRLR